jgi:threonine dehydratase
MPLTPPTLQDVLRARTVINQHLDPTPLLHSASISEHLDCDVFLKCENLQPIGAFKIRGGLYLMSRLTADEREAGVVTASTGNHGQSIAYAARLSQVPAAVYAPEGANEFKVASMKRLGAEVVLTGNDFDEARMAAEERSRETGARYVHSANEPDLIAGVGTYALEIIEKVPDLDTIIVPIGAGSGVCGSAIVMKTINPDIRVIGVQAEGFPAVYESWRQKELVALDAGQSFAEGLAARVAFELPLKIINELVDDIVLVSDREMCQGIVDLVEGAHLVAEGAGAASMAAAKKLSEQLSGQKVALIVSGGNITLETFRWAFAEASEIETRA